MYQDNSLETIINNLSHPITRAVFLLFSSTWSEAAGQTYGIYGTVGWQRISLPAPKILGHPICNPWCWYIKTYMTGS